jgi:hypothetical protein
MCSNVKFLLTVRNNKTLLLGWPEKEREVAAGERGESIGDEELK